MKRITEGNINTPEFFNKKFDGTLGVADMPRLNNLIKYYNGGVFLDVGCMDSILPIMIAERGEEAYGLDFADGIIRYLSSRFPKVKYQHIETCYKLPFEANSVDYIVAGELIEHLEFPDRFINEAWRILKPGGWLAISTPFEETISQGRIGGAQHLWAYDEADIQELMFGPEIGFTQDDGGKSILAWKQKPRPRK